MLNILRQGMRNLQMAARLSGWQFALSAIKSRDLGVKASGNYFDKDDIVVVLAPHPDDEALGRAGALMAAKRAKKTPSTPIVVN